MNSLANCEDNNQLKTQAVILCGGLATRMLPYTESTPKALLPVAGRPFLAWLFDRLEQSGFTQVLLLTGHLSSAIEEFVQTQKNRSFDVEILDEQDRKLGTGGAIWLAHQQNLLCEYFLVTYGDSYLPFDYNGPLVQLVTNTSLSGVMAVYKNDNLHDQSNCDVNTQNQMVTRYQKGLPPGQMHWIDYGATAFTRSGFVQSAQNLGDRFGLDSIQQRLAEQKLLGAHIAHERFYEIGSPSGLQALNDYLSKQSR